MVLLGYVAGSINKTFPDSPEPKHFNAGYKIVRVSDSLRFVVWYPTSEPEKEFHYSDFFSSMIAPDAPIAHGPFPLILFSHGYGGGAQQSIFFTEELARHGYIVAAPDHNDAMNTIGGKFELKLNSMQQSFTSPAKWNDSTYIRRRDDLLAILEHLHSNDFFKRRTDFKRIGLAGHSLGGYTGVGMAGGWDSWKNENIRALLLFSPYLSPYKDQGKLDSICIPVMLQGAEGDVILTPAMREKNGIYDRLKGSKYYVELNGGNHFTWTNLVCVGKKNLDECMSDNANLRIINTYAIAFFDHYLKNKKNETLHQKIRGVKDFRYYEQ